jgi:hypothetical protein
MVQKNSGAASAAGEKSPVSESTKKLDRTRFVLVHGDKGGVGKSMVSSVVADQLMTAGVKVAIIDADTRNPDVVRMFSDSECPHTCLNLRASDGWMDVIDFVHSHPGHTFVLSMPAGIGESMQQEFSDFVRFLKNFGKDGQSVQLVMWWVLNLFPDSVNLLKDALDAHKGQFDQVVVVRNNVFGIPADFIFWNESPLKTTVEAAGGLTVDLPALHLRVMKKLFDPAKIMPFSLAIKPEMAPALEFQPSERFKLESWFTEHVPAGLGEALTRLKAGV